MFTIKINKSPGGLVEIGDFAAAEILPTSSPGPWWPWLRGSTMYLDAWYHDDTHMLTLFYFCISHPRPITSMARVMSRFIGPPYFPTFVPSCAWELGMHGIDRATRSFVAYWANSRGTALDPKIMQGHLTVRCSHCCLGKNSMVAIARTEPISMRTAHLNLDHRLRMFNLTT